MLNNFIYSQTKELFEEKLASNEVLDESIVFIEDTKEIWNHGTYFGGVYSEVSHGTNDTTFTLTPNTFHIWNKVTSLTLTLGDETAGIANEYLFQFHSGFTPTTLTLPDTIKWVNDSAPNIESNKIYQISILKGFGSVLEFIVPPVLITFTINGVEYQAEEGMTWGEWITSSTEISELFSHYSETDIIPVGMNYLVDSHGSAINTTSIIVNNGVYNSADGPI